jgi:hypothetical protein
MAVRGIGIFDNDSAMDWQYELEAFGDAALISDAFSSALDEADDGIEDTTAAAALAAASVVAALIDGVHTGLPDEVLLWIDGKPAPARGLVKQARKAIAAVKESSEVRDHWEVTNDFEAWLATIEDLERRLK